MDMIEWTDAIVRLAAATFIGGVIGIDRDLRRKPTGVRTLSVVSLGAALIVLAAQYPDGKDAAAASRVMQGIITGIGFLGAGVILRDASGKKVQGFTTAAMIWLTACIGAACGAGAWALVIASGVLTGLILTLGGPLERALEEFEEDDGPHKR
jgi:putative Mg2+ transporter-C (MgtC) family protein